MTIDMGQAKRRAREAARGEVSRLTADQRAAAARSLCDRLLDWDRYRHASTIFLYLSPAGADDEPDLAPLIAEAHRAGKVLAAPRIGWNAGTMDPVTLAFDAQGRQQTEVRRMGIPEPLPGSGKLLTPNQLDLILVPGLGFDSSGGRVGRGAGYYDRYLSQILALPMPRASIVGVAFDCSVIAEVPMDQHDVRMDAVMTDRRLIIP